MLARDLQEIRSVRMRVRSSPAARNDLKAAIRTVLEKHEIKLSPKLLSELMLTLESELDMISDPGPLLPVAGVNRGPCLGGFEAKTPEINRGPKINCGPTILPRPLETRDTQRDTTGHLSADDLWKK
jgi:hypothetical protein